MITFIYFANYANCQQYNVDGWDKAKWGMTPQNVSSLYNIKNIWPNKEGFYRMVNYDIGNYTYEVWFVFHQNGLNQVNIESENILNPNRKAPTREDCKAIEGYVLRLYGKPQKSNPTPIGVWVESWDLPSTSVNFSARPDTKAEVTIIKKYPQTKPW